MLKDSKKTKNQILKITCSFLAVELYMCEMVEPNGHGTHGFRGFWEWCIAEGRWPIKRQRCGMPHRERVPLLNSHHISGGWGALRIDETSPHLSAGRVVRGRTLVEETLA
jgi:hypothetical protein